MSSIKQMLESVFSGNLTESKDAFKNILSEKIASKLKEKKKTVHSTCSEEAVEERYDADLDANKNGKLDADDFKKLRAKKKSKECHSDCNEEMELDEARFKKGEDIGKPNTSKDTGFKNLATKAGKEYGSKEAGKRVAGSILKKILANKSK
jgi:hypothetical protein